MIIVDVNVLIYAHREECDRHGECRQWLEGLWRSQSNHGISDLVLSGVLRIVIHPRNSIRRHQFHTPCVSSGGYRYGATRSSSNPGCDTELFSVVYAESGAKGNLVPDAFLAALAIESGSEWITTDRDYERFDGPN